MAEAPASKLRILIAVPSEVLRQGLHSMLAALPEVADVQTRSDPGAALVAMDSDVFDVLVISPPLCTTEFHALAESAVRSQAKVLVLLRDYDSPVSVIVEQAVALPSDGYVLESGLTTASLGDTLIRLHQGQAPMPHTLARGLLIRSRANEPKPAARPFMLTARELQVLSLLVEGLSNKQIATRLGVSEHGTKRHVAGVLAKLNCTSRTSAVALVLQQGIVNVG